MNAIKSLFTSLNNVYVSGLFECKENPWFDLYNYLWFYLTLCSATLTAIIY